MTSLCLTLTDLPPELIALIADFVHDFDDLASMSLVCHCVRNGVLLLRRWIIVEEIVTPTTAPRDTTIPTAQRRLLLNNRGLCSTHACREGLLRCVRALDLSRREVVAPLHSLRRGGLVAQCAAAPDHLGLGVCRYLHKTYKLTPDDLAHHRFELSPLFFAVQYGRIDMFKYLHVVVGMTVPREILNITCEKGLLDLLKYLHTEVGFTAEDVLSLHMRPLVLADYSGHRNCVTYLRTGYGCRKGDANGCLTRDMFRRDEGRHIRWVFELG
eukprot:TRINITY_DN3212_c0_g1_i1.p1 TRINITY_DN3212_c0_g1~~TRINITY_DN3212_c0_g1_i1.p1  ORF type:complete len:270 (-),score=22.51 TRINITY_DN3212_c0_g1_i1:167-976(-)